MSKHIPANRSQAGFTLVELAIVMIIIGLLIGGVLKGQELIKNAQVTSTVAQLKGIDGATSTFRDMYNALPGDIATPAARIKGCATSPSCNAAAGTGDGIIGAGNSLTAAPGTEARGFYTQLALADLLTGINTSAAVAACGAWGNCFPEARTGAGAGLQIGFWTGTGTLGSSAANTAYRGTYISLQTGANLAPATAAGAQALTPNQAARIDARMDDGRPGTGSVISGGNNAVCVTAGAYNETVATGDCNLFIRIQS